MDDGMWILWGLGLSAILMQDNHTMLWIALAFGLAYFGAPQAIVQMLVWV